MHRQQSMMGAEVVQNARFVKSNSEQCGFGITRIDTCLPALCVHML